MYCSHKPQRIVSKSSAASFLHLKKLQQLLLFPSGGWARVVRARHMFIPCPLLFLDLHSICAEIKRDYSLLCAPCKFMEIHYVAFDTAENVTLPGCSDCVTSSVVMTKSFHPSPIISQRQRVVFFCDFFYFFFLPLHSAPSHCVSCRCTRSWRTTRWSRCPTRRRSKLTEPSHAAPCSSTRRPPAECSRWRRRWGGALSLTDGSLRLVVEHPAVQQNHLCSWREGRQASWCWGAREQVDMIHRVVRE